MIVVVIGMCVKLLDDSRRGAAQQLLDSLFILRLGSLLQFAQVGDVARPHPMNSRRNQWA